MNLKSGFFAYNRMEYLFMTY